MTREYFCITSQSLLVIIKLWTEGVMFLLEWCNKVFTALAGSLWGRVKEQSLWSSRQLGEQSPAALLRSLVYLNTKYFGLRTVEQHLRLSFANVYGPDTVHPVTKETTVCIRVPSISQDHHGERCNMYRLCAI